MFVAFLPLSVCLSLCLSVCMLVEVLGYLLVLVKIICFSVFGGVFMGNLPLSVCRLLVEVSVYLLEPVNMTS